MGPDAGGPGIPHRVEPAGSRWCLLVPDDEVPRATMALAAYDEEAEGDAPEVSPDPASPGLAWSVGAALGVLLLAFFALTGPPAPGSDWFEQGAAWAGRTVGGEPWRAVTAMTLHVDAPHAAGNALATVVLVSPLVQQLGPGAPAWRSSS